MFNSNIYCNEEQALNYEKIGNIWYKENDLYTKRFIPFKKPIIDKYKHLINVYYTLEGYSLNSSYYNPDMTAKLFINDIEMDEVDIINNKWTFIIEHNKNNSLSVCLALDNIQTDRVKFFYYQI